MAMQFQFNLQPFGYKAAEFSFATMRVTSQGDEHYYRIDFKTALGWHKITGTVAKERSGHRNFLHLLAAILDDVDLDALGEDYVNVFKEVEEHVPGMRKPKKDYPDS